MSLSGIQTHRMVAVSPVGTSYHG